MVGWSIFFTQEAEKDLNNLDVVIRDRVIGKISWLSENFESIFPTPLAGTFRDFNKLRIGDWRVFYSINWKEKSIVINYIGHRSKAYKKKKPRLKL